MGHQITQIARTENGGKYKVSISIPFELGWIERVKLNITTRTQKNVYPMQHIKNEGDMAYFETTIELPRYAVYHYYFSFEANSRFQYYKKESTSGDNSVTNEECWKLSVNFDVPEWAKGAIMYQIFVDRYKRTRGLEKKPMKGRDIHENWNEPPVVGPNEKGQWCVDFYCGDVKGITDTMKYIKKLGVDIIYLCPISESQSNHRYDTSDYRSIDPYAGTSELVKEMCEKAHKYGMQVILDVVFDHTGNDSVYYNEYGNYDSIGAYQVVKIPEYKGKVSPTIAVAIAELKNAWKGEPVLLEKKRTGQGDGFAITSSEHQVRILSSTEAGLLYGVYSLLRMQAAGQVTVPLSVTEQSVYDLRILNHWDNPDGTVERGYAGCSLWNWEELPGTLSPRYEAYARANASVGINGTVLNNVNASPQVLATGSLEKVKALADVFRPYGIKVYLSVNFASPIQLGKLDTADPLDKEVIRWWRRKVKEIYTLIPDFGGFLVKANSEGQPGPCDFGRTHAEGANMLADALKPYGGIVMWRAFVYSPTDSDRAKQAYLEFMPLDGQFHDNVIVQIKNGPIDFQPREPYSPLFTAMKQTSMMVEFQITQEYLGFSNHLAYLAPLWEEFFGEVRPDRLKAVAGVANIGTDVNWCGHHFAQANWYAFGRLAWNPSLTSDRIADEWLRQTFTSQPAFVRPVKEMMLQSREAVVNYMMPLGLHHQFAWGHHYGPEPWCSVPGARPDWLPSYYHKADKEGIGFDRSSKGSDAVSQYPDSLRQIYNDKATCPEIYLLWFHHVPWQHQMKSGRTLWGELCHAYDRGVRQVRGFQEVWDSVEPFVDVRRFREVQSKLKIQMRDAVWWKDACLLYFQTFSGMPIPAGIERPVHELEDMKRFRLEISNYECPESGFNK